MVEVKFCGMTRAEDATAAARCGARYVGVVFAGGPRQQSEAHAAEIFAGVPAGVARVGVFGSGAPDEIAQRAQRLRLDVVQLHGDPEVADVEALRARWPGRVWAALRVAGLELPRRAAALFSIADAVLLDAKVEGAAGGSGVPLAWRALSVQVERVRSGTPGQLVLAGGLRATNVAEAVGALRPDVVDVSSGIESTVGIKDEERMRAFFAAVQSAEDAQ